MNKLKVSKKAVKDNYMVLGVGYCGLQHLLKYRDPFGYSVGVYGWACDYYDIDGVIISTGYQPLKSKNVVKDYEMIREYDDKARAIDNRADMEILLNEFIKKVKGYK